ncbi:MAG: cell division protein FtsA [Clostridiales bacterium]|nr:cell division protein FtsA [Clostridiales bacterium]
MPKSDVIVGLDIGTSKVAAIVGEIHNEGDGIRIIGVGEAPSSGLRKGVVVDMDGTAKAISEAVATAEQMSGVKIESCLVGITGTHISSIINRGVVAVADQDGEITVEDAKRVLGAAKVIALPPDRRIIHVLPREYIVDGYDGIVDPVGMTGSRLEVETNIVTGAAAAIQNTLKALERANLHVQELVLNPLASAEAVLFPAERELASIVVDIGGGTTGIALFDSNGLFYTSVIPIGGDHVTSDLAVGLRTPLSQAEKIKKEYGCVLADLMPDDDYINITSVGGQNSRSVSQKTIASIIQPRMEEILSLVKEEIKKSSFKGLIPGGVILTGGCSLFQGLEQLAAEELGMPVRIGYPYDVGGLSDIVNSTAYATCIGLIKYGKKHAVAKEAVATSNISVKEWLEKIKIWFKDLF